MKKKSELTEPELYFIINSTDCVEDIAEKVGCSKRVVSSIREKNPLPEKSVDPLPTPETSMFMKSVKSSVRDGKDSVYIMTEGASEMIDDSVKQRKKTDTSAFITKIFTKD